jgi:hypothetical protein
VPGGKVLIVEPKFHVTKNDFEKAKETMKRTGYIVIEEPKIFFSRAVLLEKKV